MRLEEYYTCNEMNMILELTNACNLRCEYCFENCQTEERHTKPMSSKVIKASIDFLVENNSNCHLTFFGGEPTLCPDLMKYALEYASAKARKSDVYISFSIVTNGTNMGTDIINLLNDYDVNVVFSFDGNEYSQNKYRKYFDGRDSYHTVKDNLVRLLETRKDCRNGHIIVRPTITSETIPFMNTIYKDFVKLGTKEISFSFVSSKRENSYAIKNEDIVEIEKQFKIMTYEYYNELRNGYSYNKFFEGVLERIKSAETNLEFCDCGKRYIAIDVNGNIYPCEGFIGVEEYKMGNIFDKEVSPVCIKAQNVEENKKCNKCWAKYLCCGSCYHEAWMMTGDINGRDDVVCQTYKLSFLYGLKLYSKIKENSIEIDDIFNDDILPARSVPHLNKECVLRVDDKLIYSNSLKTSKMIWVNETAMNIFELIDDSICVEKISKTLRNKYKIKYDIYEDVCKMINYFMDNNIVSLRV